MNPTRALARDLDSLATPAPLGLDLRVLERIGIVDRWERVDVAPVGPVFVAASPRGIVHIDQAGSEEEFLECHAARFGRPARRGAVPLPALRALERGDSEGVPIDLRGTGAFRAAALERIRTIPRGQVRSYSWVAREIGRERAVRAVGTAMATNPIPLLIPCHRVVRNDGLIGAYGLGGPEVKRRLLLFEGLDLTDAGRYDAGSAG